MRAERRLYERENIVSQIPGSSEKRAEMQKQRKADELKEAFVSAKEIRFHEYDDAFRAHRKPFSHPLNRAQDNSLKHMALIIPNRAILASMHPLSSQIKEGKAK